MQTLLCLCLILVPAPMRREHLEEFAPVLMPLVHAKGK